jgi:hypothetical protein
MKRQDDRTSRLTLAVRDAGAKGVQFVECAHQSWKERRRVDVPSLEI